MRDDEVMSKLRRILLNGEIAPSARIPERELCAQLGVSRTAIRDALKVLAAEGLVQLLPHRGARAAKLSAKDMQDLFEVCQGLEAMAGALACERVTDAECADIRMTHEAMISHYRNGDLVQYYRLNRQIHRAIVNAARNPVLSELYGVVAARIRRARHVVPMEPQRWAAAAKEHEFILDALLRRDGAALADILRRHLRDKWEDVVRAGFAETNEPPPAQDRHGLFGGNH